MYSSRSSKSILKGQQPDRVFAHVSELCVFFLQGNSTLLQAKNLWIGEYQDLGVSKVLFCGWILLQDAIEQFVKRIVFGVILSSSIASYKKTIKVLLVCEELSLARPDDERPLTACLRYIEEPNPFMPFQPDCKTCWIPQKNNLLVSFP